MNRKLVNGLLLLSIATVGCGTFTSCKDTDESYKNEVILSQEQLVSKLIAYIDQHQCDCDLPEDTKELLSKLRDFLGNNATLNDAVKALINGTLDGVFGEDYQTWLKKENLTNLVHQSDLTNYAKTSDLNKYALASELSKYLDVNSEDYKKLLKDVEDNGKNIGDLSKLAEQQTEDIEAAMKRANDAYMEALSAMNAITDINEWYASEDGFKKEVLDIVNNALEPIKNELKTLQPQIDAIRKKLAQLITGVLVQQTYNPLFGSINLPIGLQSNVVANYYGVSDHALKFPFNVGADNYEYNGDNSVLAKNAGIAAAAAALTPKNGYASISANTPYVADDNDYNMGKIYLTINPNTVDFSGVTLSLVNSQDQKAAVDALVVEKDDETVLNFGWTRADNGFYAAKVNVSNENAPELALRIESGLKSAMKDALLDHTKSDFASLGKLVLKQMENVAPAYGIKAAWTTTDEIPEVDAEGNLTGATKTVKEEHAVYSKYDICAATLHPLGYQFLYGEGTEKELPTFGKLSDALDRVFEDIKKDAHFDFSEVKFNLDGATIEISFKDLTIDGKHFDEDHNTVILGYKDGVAHVAGDNNTALNPIIGEIVTKVNKVLDELEGEINRQVAEMLDKINNQLAGKLGTAQKLVDKYNDLAKRINKFLKNPNHYLQVMMAYETKNGGFGRLSNDFNDPSVFTQAGGNTIELFATSYTAELVAPSYKKYVAVTRAWEGNVEKPAEAAAVNAASEYLNFVAPGRQQSFGLTGLKSGIKYEIIYTSLDYRGRTSTNTYYLLVK